MKDQYFGDINDFRKYGLLRCLLEVTKMKLGVCWLLTCKDRRNDGEFRQYLKQPKRWCRFDPALFKKMCKLLQPHVAREVAHARKWRILPNAIYFGKLLVDNAEKRNEYFKEVWNRLRDCQLLFFDPDNGIEIESVRRGNRNSAKYLFWEEIDEAYKRGHSLVIYQHFPFVNREHFIATAAYKLAKQLNTPFVDSFRTAHVVFFLIARPEHAVEFERAHDHIVERWPEQIRPATHGALTSASTRTSASDVAHACRARITHHIGGSRMAATITRSPDRSINNALELTVDQVVNERVDCPLCKDKVFKRWPEGWDAHAAHKCSGVSGATERERKKEFKRLVRHLFR